MAKDHQYECPTDGMEYLQLLSVKIDQSNIRDKDIGQVLKCIKKPNWEIRGVGENWEKIVRLSWKSGYTGDVPIAVRYLHKGLHNTLLTIIIKSSREVEDVLVCRIFHESSKYTVDHNLETCLIQHLNPTGCFMPVYCRFENGYVYQHARGETLTSHNVRNNDIIRAICKELHELHKVRLPENILQKTFKSLDSRSQILFGTLRQAGFDQNFENNLQAVGMNLQILLRLSLHALHCFQALVLSFDGVTCHNDVNYSNIVYNICNNTVKLIDFEHLLCLPEIIDLAMMCTCTQDIGHGLLDLQNTPPICSDLQLLDQWVRIYLETHPKYKQLVTDALVNKWKTGIEIYAYYGQIMDLFICLSHYFMFLRVPIANTYLQRAAQIYRKILTDGLPDFKLKVSTYGHNN